MKNNTNYFFVNRALLHSDRWLSETFTRGQAWVDLFGLAQHTKGFFRVRGIQVDVDRGQLGYSQVTLAKRWRWSRNKVRRYLKELEKNGDITLKTKHQNIDITTIITIVKYDLWQSGGTPSETPEGHQKDTKRNTYKNDKNEKKEKKYTSNDKSLQTTTNNLIELFKPLNPISYTKWYSNTTQRKAVERLNKLVGIKKLQIAINIAVEANNIPYAPTITTPLQLEEKLSALRAFVKKTQSKQLQGNKNRVCRI